MRQCGTRVHPGANVGIGRDWTLFALIDGTVKYERLGKDRTPRAHRAGPRAAGVTPPLVGPWAPDADTLRSAS